MFLGNAGYLCQYYNNSFSPPINVLIDGITRNITVQLATFHSASKLLLDLNVYM